MDGKQVGWHDYDDKASTRLEQEFIARMAEGTHRTTWHLKSGHFKYEVNLLTMTQRNTSSGTIRNIRRFVDPQQPQPGDAQNMENLPPVAKKLKTDTSASAMTLASVSSMGSNGLQLDKLFDGAPKEWREALLPVLENAPDASTFIGASRSKDILPLRELTFQALKPNPPHKWNVIVFGQAPYPRIESSTGIAMFDAKIDSWDSKQFGKAVSMRCIMKVAAMAKHGIPSDTKISTLREKFRDDWDVVSPMEWFQAMLSQNVLLLNASLTTGGSPSKTQHLNFWKPVISKIVETVLQAKADKAEKTPLLFLWWGADALRIKKTIVEPILATHAADPNTDNVEICHMEHYNPAAQGEKFCHGDPCHFLAVNDKLKSLGAPEIDWLPNKAWLEQHGTTEHGQFVEQTKELHEMYLQRLQDGLIASSTPLQPISGIMDLPPEPLPEACASLHLEGPAKHAVSVATDQLVAETLSIDEKAAVYMYTGNSLYRQLNEALRNPDRTIVTKYSQYLRQFLSAFDKLSNSGKNKDGNSGEAKSTGLVPDMLYRGVHKDLSHEYPKGKIVTWWNVSSSTPNINVAKSFGGSTGTLFRIQTERAVPIMHLSAFKGEEEYVLAPGTQLRVVSSSPKKGTSAAIITLEEITDKDRLVN